MTDKLREQIQALIDSQFAIDPDDLQAILNKHSAALATAPQPEPTGGAVVSVPKTLLLEVLEEADADSHAVEHEFGGDGQSHRDRIAELHQLAAAPQPGWLEAQIYSFLRDYRQEEVRDEDGDGYPLVDALTMDGHGIDMGEREIGNIARELAHVLMTPAPQPVPMDREALVEGIAQIIDHPSVYMGGPSRNSLRIAEAIVKEYADALLARGLCLPGVVAHETASHDTQAPLPITDDTQAAPETMAWAVVDEYGRIDADSIAKDAMDVRISPKPGLRVVPVMIRLVEGGDDEA